MTETKPGRVYIDYRWEVKDGEYFYTPSFPEDYVRTETPHLVPNGKWVMERPSWGCGYLAGVEFDELEQLLYNDKDDVRRGIFICDRPFGFVMVEPEDVIVYPDVVKPSSRKTLVYARQVHKGELGRGVHTPTLDYVRQPLPSHRGLGMKARERRRGQHGWVKLADLGEMSGCGYRPDKEVELILGFWQFSGHRNYRFYENDQDGGQLVDVAWGSGLDIESGNAEFKSLTQEQFRKECFDTSEVWVRRGFAYTILRLQALGVKPEVLQPT